MTEEIQISIIGGGVVGCAIAYELSKSLDQQICVLERNSSIRGENQSSRNSGVIHAGIYYPKKKGPLKARLCVEGNRMLYEFCERFGVPYKKTGKLVVATNPLEEEYLDDLVVMALENGIPGVKKISREEVKELEPNVCATSALYIPTSGIVEPTRLVSKLHQLAEANGVIFLTGNEVIDINHKKGLFEISTKSKEGKETFGARIVINAAGLYADTIARMMNPESPFRMDPVRAESAKFYKTRRANIHMNGMNVYPTPYGMWPTGERAEVSFPEFQRLFAEGKVSKTVGVHLTPTFEEVNGKYTIGNTVTVGPYPVGKVGKVGREEYRPTRTPEQYLKRVQGFFPGLCLEDLELHQTGIRAKLEERYDFVIERDPKHPKGINVVGTDSPGLTASLAIAGEVRKLLE